MLMFFLRRRRPPRSPLFPYTTLCRSSDHLTAEIARRAARFTALDAAAVLRELADARERQADGLAAVLPWVQVLRLVADRKSTRLNSSHANISYAGFCLDQTLILSIPL